MCILVRVFALCLGRAFRTKSVKFNGESQSKRSCTSAAKWKYFHGFLTFTDGEYTCEMQVMHLGKEHVAPTARGTRSLSVRAALNSKDLSLLIHAIY